MTNHPELPGTEGFLGLTIFNTKAGRVPGKLRKAGQPRWAMHSIPPVTAPFTALNFLIIHTKKILSFGAPSPFQAGLLGKSQKGSRQALSFSHVPHIWCMRNTQTSFSLVGGTADPNIATLLCSCAQTSYWPISPTLRISQMWVRHYRTS